MPLYEFRCCRCDRNIELYFGMDERKDPRCMVCNDPLCRVFSPAAIRPNGVKHTPPGMVEVGTESIKAAPKPDRFADVEREMHQVIEQCPDLDGSGDCELSKLHA